MRASLVAAACCCLAAAHAFAPRATPPPVTASNPAHEPCSRHSHKRCGGVRRLHTVCRATDTRRGGGGGASSTKAARCQVVEVEGEFDTWKLAPVIDILQNGGLGVLPTDTCYVFCCDVHSRRGVDRIFQLKQYVGKRKPLSLLCKDISTISKHSDGVDKDLFKVLKKALPGPYTFIVPATHQVPRILLEHKSHKKTWKRREVGVRIPDQPVLHAVLEALENPLICSSVPYASETATEADDDFDDSYEGADEAWSRSARAELATDPQQIVDLWGHAVDFVVDAGPIASSGVSTVVNCMVRPPEVLRAGLGDPALLGL